MRKTYSLRIQLGILLLKHPPLRPRDINNPINDNMRDMNTLRSKLPRQRLRQRSQRELARRKGSELRRALETGCRAGENESRRVFQPSLRLSREEWEDILGEVECSFSVFSH